MAFGIDGVLLPGIRVDVVDDRLPPEIAHTLIFDLEARANGVVAAVTVVVQRGRAEVSFISCSTCGRGASKLFFTCQIPRYFHLLV